MIRVPYNVQMLPPAPLVRVHLCSPKAGSNVLELPAQIDTGADRSLVPLAILNQLNLTPLKQILIAGVGGRVQTMPVYGVLLSVVTLTEHLVSVLGHAEEPWIILGRDVLNHHRMVLDGPNQLLEMS